MTPKPEFSRPVRVEHINRIGGDTHIEADEAERVALMRRFGLLALDRLEARYSLTEAEDGIVARGHVDATLSQACVATGQPVPERIATDFTLRFVVEDATPAEEEEMELDAQDVDTVGYDGLSIDMGEAVAETMALTMAPYPRAPDADATLREAGVLSEEQASPFAALLALKKDV